MTPAHDIDLSAVLAERLTTAHPDVLRELLATFIPDFTGAEADAVCGAGSNERSTDRSQAPWVNTCQSPYRAPELMGFSSGDGRSAVLLAAFALLGSGFTAVRSPSGRSGPTSVNSLQFNKPFDRCRSTLVTQRRPSKPDDWLPAV